MWSRRRFLHAGTATIVLVVYGSACKAPRTEESKQETFRELLKESVTSMPSPPRPLGGQWLAAIADNPPREFAEISNLLEQRFQGKLPSSRRRLRAALAVLARDDFLSGRIQRVDNWYLSETECLLLAAKEMLDGQDSTPQAVLAAAPIDDHFDPDTFSQGVLRQVTAWGPKATAVGQPFNVQPSGASAMWFSTERDTTSVSVYLDDIKLVTTSDTELVTADLVGPESLRILNQKATYTVYFIDRNSKTKQKIGIFEVKAGTPQKHPSLDDLEKAKLAAVKRWGPQSTRLGKHFNIQPNGHSAFWIEIADPQGDLSIFLGEIELPTISGKGLITASLTFDQVEKFVQVPASRKLYLVSYARRAKQLVGTFKVHP